MPSNRHSSQELLKLLQSALPPISRTRQLTEHSVPSKRRTKLSSTKVSPNSFNQNLRGVPGHRDAYISTMKQIHDEITGCIVATPAQLAKLERSAHNSNTTETDRYHLRTINQTANISPKTLMDRRW